MLSSVYFFVHFFLGLGAAAYLMILGVACLYGAQVPPRFKTFGSHLMAAFALWRAVGAELPREPPMSLDPPAGQARDPPDNTA
jgi:hypothetical protein